MVCCVYYLVEMVIRRLLSRASIRCGTVKNTCTSRSCEHRAECLAPDHVHLDPWPTPDLDVANEGRSYRRRSFDRGCSSSSNHASWLAVRLSGRIQMDTATNRLVDARESFRFSEGSQGCKTDNSGLWKDVCQAICRADQRSPFCHHVDDQKDRTRLIHQPLDSLRIIMLSGCRSIGTCACCSFR